MHLFLAAPWDTRGRGCRHEPLSAQPTQKKNRLLGRWTHSVRCAESRVTRPQLVVRHLRPRAHTAPRRAAMAVSSLLVNARHCQQGRLQPAERSSTAPCRAAAAEWRAKTLSVFKLVWPQGRAGRQQAGSPPTQRDHLESVTREACSARWVHRRRRTPRTETARRPSRREAERLLARSNAPPYLVLTRSGT